MVPGDRSLITIGCKYNTRKVISFIFTSDAGTTTSGIPYLSNYHGPFYNVSICPVASPVVMYKFFGYVNDVESHNRSRQSNFSL